MTQRNPRLSRARYWGACATLAAGTGLLLGSSSYAASATPDAAPSTAPISAAKSAPRMSELIGANGWPTSTDDFRFWQAMGLSWGRDSVGPGRSVSSSSPLDIDKTSPTYNADLPPVILGNNKHGIQSLIFLGYTPSWNATVPGDGNSAPKDEHYWQEYVEAVVKKYSAPPYNVKYFQIWNEAAGSLSVRATAAIRSMRMPMPRAWRIM